VPESSPEQRFKADRSWPPPGHYSTYTAKFDLEGFESFEYEMTVPTGEIVLGNAIVGRLGGPSPADVEFRARLYQAIGALTVSGGHVEAAMKRMILTLQGKKSRFSLVDKNWTELHMALESESAKNDLNRSYPAMRDALAGHLAWGKQRHLKDHRDNIVHGYIWDYAMPMVTVSRFRRKKDGENMMYTLDDVERIAKNLAEYGDRLDSMLHGIWHEVMLPATTVVPGFHGQ